MSTENTQGIIKYPGSYKFQVDTRIPEMVVGEMFVHMEKVCPGIDDVRYTPATLSEKQILYPPTIDGWPWDGSRVTRPRKDPTGVVLDWRGLMTELVFTRKALQIDGTFPYWSISLEDRGSLRLIGGKMEFTHPYDNRCGRLYVTMEGFLPDSDKYEPNPETFDPTQIEVYLEGKNRGPLVTAALSYINQVAPKERQGFIHYHPRNTI